MLQRTLVDLPATTSSAARDGSASAGLERAQKIGGEGWLDGVLLRLRSNTCCLGGLLDFQKLLPEQYRTPVEFAKKVQELKLSTVFPLSQVLPKLEELLGGAPSASLPEHAVEWVRELDTSVKQDRRVFFAAVKYSVRGAGAAGIVRASGVLKVLASACAGTSPVKSAGVGAAAVFAVQLAEGEKEDGEQESEVH